MSVPALSPLVEQQLDAARARLGRDYDAYRGHVRRVLAYCEALAPERFAAERQVFDIAAVFHDLALWTEMTMDYLPPSRALAETYLANHAESAQAPRIGHMIDHHHRLRGFRGEADQLTEIFRRADWIDVSMGLLRFGIPKSRVKAIVAEVPFAGFHQRLIALWVPWFGKHPLRPLPMMRW